MLTDLPTYKVSAGILDASQDAQLGELVKAADAIVKAFTKRDLETASYLEFRDGSGTQDLALYQRPVRIYLLTGNLVNGSPVITGLASASLLLVGMPVASQDSNSRLPKGATIQSVDSPTQVTLTGNCTATVNGAALVFGLNVYLDTGGYYGQGINPFAGLTQLFLGRDFALRIDQPDGSSKSGILRRLGGGPVGDLGWPWGWGERRGTLTARPSPIWANWNGNIRAQYTAGLGTGPRYTSGTLPYDLTDAANMLVSRIRRDIPQGGPLTKEQIGRYMYELGEQQAGEAPEVTSVRQILSRYREVSV